MSKSLDDSKLTITMGRRLGVCARILSVAWSIRSKAVVGFLAGASLEIAGMVIAIYATAKLGALLAAFVTIGATSYIWFWLWVDVAAGVLSGIGFLAMSYCKRIVYFSLVRWSINKFLGALCKIEFCTHSRAWTGSETRSG